VAESVHRSGGGRCGRGAGSRTRPCPTLLPLAGHLGTARYQGV